MAAAAARPLAELLACPAEAGDLLTLATQSLVCEAGDRVFRQGEAARGLYLVVTGEFLRRSERLNTRVTLGSVHPGDLVELAAALGDQQHTYTLNALTPGTLLLLPIEALRETFDRHPPMRMRLLEELAREVSRAYFTSTLSRIVPTRRRGSGEARA